MCGYVFSFSSCAMCSLLETAMPLFSCSVFSEVTLCCVRAEHVGVCARVCLQRCMSSVCLSLYVQGSSGFLLACGGNATEVVQLLLATDSNTVLAQQNNDGACR